MRLTRNPDYDVPLPSTWSIESLQEAMKAADKYVEQYDDEDVRAFVRVFLVDRFHVLLGNSGKASAKWPYPTYEDLILEYGEVRKQDYFIPGEDSLFLGAEPSMCFLNCYNVICERPEEYVYVEGKAAAGGLIVNHAWLEMKDGTIVDPTWGQFLDDRPYTPVYYGIRFSTDFVLRRAAETGWCSILPNEWQTRPDEFLSLRYGFELNDAGHVANYKGRS